MFFCKFVGQRTGGHEREFLLIGFQSKVSNMWDLRVCGFLLFMFAHTLVSCDVMNTSHIETSAAIGVEQETSISLQVRGLFGKLSKAFEESHFEPEFQVVLAIVLGLGGFAVFFCRGRKKVFKGDAIFLVGPCDGGKTSLFFRIRDGTDEDKLRATHTSMIPNESTFIIRETNAQQDVDQKPMRFIDFPGHRRLRSVLFANLEDCRAIIFVLDACKFASQG